MAYDPVTKIYTPDYTPNPDAYIERLTSKGFSKAEAASSARYQAYADKYFAPDGPGANIDPNTGGLRTPVATGPTQAELDAIEAANKEAARKAKEAADKKAQDEKDAAARRDAFVLIKDSLKTYGFTEAEITELNAFIESVITDVKIGPELAKVKLREQPTYQARFVGNKGRVAKGFNALTEAQYLQQGYPNAN